MLNGARRSPLAARAASDLLRQLRLALERARLLAARHALPSRAATSRARAQIRALFDAQLTAPNVAGEVAYLSEPSRGDVRAAVRMGVAADARRGARAARQRRGARMVATPRAARRGVRRTAFASFFPKATYPIRVGTHFNTAFALALALEYAGCAFDDDAFARSAPRDGASTWYSSDADCQAWEPGGDDFLSSALIEAECMRRALDAARSGRTWIRSLPAARRANASRATLFAPATVSDRTRRQDRAPRRAESQPRVVLAVVVVRLGAGRSASRDRARGRGRASGGEPAARRRRLRGRALARDVRAARAYREAAGALTAALLSRSNRAPRRRAAWCRSAPDPSSAIRFPLSPRSITARASASRDPTC